MDFHDGSEDVKGVMSQFTLQEDLLRIKRMWLAGLPITKREKSLIFDSDRFLPESLLREDDVFYERIKSFVERGVNGYKEEKEQALGKNMLPLNLSNDLRFLWSLLDYMTNECLCSVADILTHGSVDFEKIRWKMIKVIKDNLRKKTLCPNDDLFKKLSPLLKDPRSFRMSPVKLFDSSSQSYIAAVQNVLDGLDDLPTIALLAMHRKVRDVRGYIPQLKPLKHGWRRDKLISLLRETCIRMLSAGEGDKSRELLNEAMGVAVLALKLRSQGNQYVKDLKMFSPDVQVVQLEITKALWFLKKRARFEEIKELQLLLDPESKLSHRSFRGSLRNLLTDSLFECNDMDSIPEGTPKAVAVINQKSRSVSLKYFSKEDKEDIEKEVESILSVGAHLKQIVWDLPVKHKFDYDFADSYMEDSEDSEESDDDECHVNDYIKNEPSDNSRYGSAEQHDPWEISDEKIINKKPYLTIQGASDETSLFVYRLIGHLMEEFAQIEGLQLDLDKLAYLRSGEAKQNEDHVANEKSDCRKDDYGSVIIQSVQELWPSFPQSGKNRLEEMMSSS